MLAESRKNDAVLQTNLPLPVVGRGKVRDIYAVGDDKLLIVTTDRLSAFDVVLPNPIPNKGKVLTQISIFWFNHFQNLIQHHLITGDIHKMGFAKDFVAQYGPQIEGRSMLVQRAKPLSVECVVRGYLAGSGWKDYQKTQAVCGHQLPAGLRQCEKLPQFIFTPATKEETGHDINIDFDETVKREGEEIAARIRDLSIEIYTKGAEYAAQKGIIIADTKFEFGLRGGNLILIDEVLTPDSSRFWPKDVYEVGHDQPSYDKQIVRNYVESLNWDKKPPAPELTPEVIEKTSQAYQDVFKRLTGKDLA
ncbi:MAG: phosphoribosylaminoimidazolesuccinocarboxamide synthase [Candidatus Omnitrophica bacterium]|nr:phosphoribosylaminoimidazolesuccinocarboxamide synthase [Candidatus Omnitrophota bacterium]